MDGDGNGRHDQLKHLQTKREALERAWMDFLTAYAERFLPRRENIDTWTDEDLIAALRHAALILRQPGTPTWLEAFGKGDFEAPRMFDGQERSDGGA